jgi:hypothetical protein
MCNDFFRKSECKEFCDTRKTIVVRDSGNKQVLDETDNLQKPNPPAPLPYEGRGVSKPISTSRRGLERGLFIH